MAEASTGAPGAAAQRSTPLRGLGLSGIALRPLWRGRASALIQAAGLLAALTLGLLVPLAEAMSAEAGLRSAVRAAGDGANIEVQRSDIRTTAALDAYVASVRSQVVPGMAGTFQSGVSFASTGPQVPLSINGVAQSPPFDYLPAASTYSNLTAHAQIVEGSFPAGPGNAEPYPAAITVTAAKRLGIGLNDVYCAQASLPRQFVNARGETFCARVLAIWRPVDPSGAYWDGHVPDQDLVLAEDDFFAVGRQLRDVIVRATTTFTPIVNRLAVTQADDLVARVNRLRGGYEIASDIIFFTGFDRAVVSFQRRLQASHYAAQLVGAGILGLTIFSLVFLTDHFLRGTQDDVRLWLIRGWAWPRAWLVLAGRQALLGLLTLLPAVLLTVAVLTAMARGLFAGETALTAADVLALSPVIGLIVTAAGAAVALTALASVRAAVPAARRLPLPAWWRRSGAVEAAIALAGIALLAQARATLSGGGPPPTDLLAMAAPGAGLLLLALAALRVLGMLARLAARGEGLPALLAAWQIGRRSSQYSQLALLLAFAVAIGLFASAFIATDQRNGLDRAAYASGADFRAVFSRGLVPVDLSAQGAKLQTATASSAVTRVAGRPGRSMDFDSTLLGVDPASFWSVAWTRSDLDGGREPALTAEMARRDPDGLALGSASELSIWARSSAAGVKLAATVMDADGRTVDCDFGSPPAGTWQQLRCSLPAATGERRLRTLSLIPPTGAASQSSVDLSDLAAGGRLLESFAAQDGWWSHAAAVNTRPVALAASSVAVRDGKASSSAALDGTTILHPTPSSKPIPALVSTGTLQRLGLQVGQAFPMHVDTVDLQLVPIAAVDYWPTLYPGGDLFFVLPQATMLERLGAQGAFSPWPNELWLKTRTSPTAVRQELTARFSTAVIGTDDRPSDQAAALDDPLRLSLDAELVGGFLAALALVVVGFGLHFAAVARGRLSEYAIMRANGLRQSAVATSVLIEQGLLLVFGAALGVGLGVLAALTILPVLAPSSLPQDLVPPTWVDLAPGLAAVVLVVLVALCLLVGRLAVRIGAHFDLVAELRSLS